MKPSHLMNLESQTARLLFSCGSDSKKSYCGYPWHLSQVLAHSAISHPWLCSSMPLFVLSVVIPSSLTSCINPLSSLGHCRNSHWALHSPVFFKIVGHQIHVANHDEHFKINEIELNRKVKDVSSTCIRVRILLWTLFQMCVVCKCVCCVLLLCKMLFLMWVSVWKFSSYCFITIPFYFFTVNFHDGVSDFHFWNDF